jgi:hypothetical protein
MHPNPWWVRRRATISVDRESRNSRSQTDLIKTSHLPRVNVFCSMSGLVTTTVSQILERAVADLKEKWSRTRALRTPSCWQSLASTKLVRFLKSSFLSSGNVPGKRGDGEKTRVTKRVSLQFLKCYLAEYVERMPYGLTSLYLNMLVTDTLFLSLDWLPPDPPLLD